MGHDSPKDWKQIDSLLSNLSVATSFVLPKNRTQQGWGVLCISDRFGSFPAFPTSRLCCVFEYASSVHQLNSIPHYAHHRPRLDRLTSTSRDSVLNLCQPIKPCDHDFWLNLQLC